MITGNLATIARLLQSKSTVDQQQFHGIAFDTRTLVPGNLFIALPGKNHDGHEFLSHAAEKGAVAAVIISKTNYHHHVLPTILVQDPLWALGCITSNWRQQFNFPIIGITGSNGKTTVKNMLAAILSAHCQNQNLVLATIGNFNNALGVPYMLAQINQDHRYAVLEMGTSNFGEIAVLSRLVKPNMIIINNAGPAHLDNLGNLTGVAQAKGEIFAGLLNPGRAILNADDTYYDYWSNLARSDTKIFSFGINNRSSTIRGMITHNNNRPNHQTCSVFTPEGTSELSLPLIGKHNINNALAATAAAIALGINLTTIKHGLSLTPSVAGRLQIHKFNHAINLIDDSYNANPASVQAAIDTLATFPGNKIMILGNMGITSIIAHQHIGVALKKAQINFCFTYGTLAQFSGEQFGNNSYHCTGQDELITTVKPYITPNTTILIKGARIMAMENILLALKTYLAQI